ncbi:crooked neck 1-like protein [Trifolium pratense]|uniref:Crooked neck 1-like protein n=1 Tax=Trifolium pratense TaxID=57577 RepID=A0A2K3MZI4_TRIPR|nr:crooked neck 1-like protein [Trifolium pratense]
MELQVHEIDPAILVKRKEFEELIQKFGCNLKIWIKYARWEEYQQHFNRSRYIWERALEKFQYKHSLLWLKYAEFEMRNRQFRLARNVWDRAVTFLPEFDQLWFNYIQMEQNMLDNVVGARKIFKRLARQVFEGFVSCHPTVAAWLSYAEFEMKNGDVTKTRNVYRRALDKLADDKEVEQLFVSFVEFEVRCNNETEREEEEDCYGLSLLESC